MSPARYRSPGAVHVEADASSASYFIALGALAATRYAGLRIEGVGAESIQGDIRFIDAARAMGARIDSGPNWLRVARGHFDAENHFAFEAAAWYWHFVDVVWLLLYVVVYWV